MPKNKKNSLSGKNKCITEYFGKINDKSVAATNFYKECLETKVNLCRPEKNCHEAKKLLEDRCAQAKEKLERIKKANEVCLSVMKKKDDVIEILKSRIQLEKSPQVKPSPEKSSPEKRSPEFLALPPPKTILFENCKTLSEDQLSKLRSLDNSKRPDSTFVLNSVRFFYSDNLEKLKGKSVKGINKGKPTQAMSPVKLDLMKLLYKERLLDMHLTTEEMNAREKKFNRHVHGAITNINAKPKNLKMSINISN